MTDHIKILTTFLIGLVATATTLQGKEEAAITVMSYNIHYGVGTDKQKDLKRIAKVITDQKPDIVGLQEIGSLTMAVDVELPESMGKGKQIRFVNTHFDCFETAGSKQARLDSVDVIEETFFKKKTRYPHRRSECNPKKTSFEKAC